MQDFKSIAQTVVGALEDLAQRVCAFEHEHQRAPEVDELAPSSFPALVHTIENAPFALALHRDGRSTYVNRRAGDILGKGTRGQIVGLPLERFIHEDSLEAASQLLDRLERRVETNGGAELRLVALDDTVLDVVGLSLVLRDPGSTVCSLFLDVPRPRGAERELRGAQQRYDLLAERAEDLVIELDENGTLVYCSPNHERVLGFRPEELLGRRGVDLLNPEDRAAAPYVSEGRLGLKVTRRARHRDGSERWLETSSLPFTTPEGGKRMLAIAHDVTDRVHAQAGLKEEVARRTAELERANRELQRVQSQLLASERLGAIEDGTARVVHAIGNPLAALVGTVELAVEASPVPDPTLERILALTQRVRSVVDGTHQLFRGGALRLEPRAPEELLQQLCAALERRAKTQGIRIEQRLGGALPRVEIDPSSLPQALLRLAENALDAMPEGGVLRVDAEALPGARVVVLRLRDTGPGIPDELRERIFEPFFTTRGGAAGLGLAIARGTVQGHRGRLRVENHPDGGAEVTVELPCAD